MNLRLIPLCCLAFLPLAHAEGERLTYTCDDGSRFDVAFSADSDGRPQASLRFAGREITLPQVVAASGASYRSGDVVLHTKEEKALFSDGKSRLRSCQQAGSTPAAAQPAAGAFVDIGGSVAWTDGAPLPPDAVLIIRVQDTARADAPALTLAEQRIGLAGQQAPLPFRLTIDRDLLHRNAVVTVSARIERRGRLFFINDSVHPAFVDGQPRQVAMQLRPVGAAPGR